MESNHSKRTTDSGADHFKRKQANMTASGYYKIPNNRVLKWEKCPGKITSKVDVIHNIKNEEQEIVLKSGITLKESSQWSRPLKKESGETWTTRFRT